MTLLEAKQKAFDAGEKLRLWDETHYPKEANPTGQRITRWLSGRYALEISSRAASRNLIKVRQENGIFEPLHA